MRPPAMRRSYMHMPVTHETAGAAGRLGRNPTAGSSASSILPKMNAYVFYLFLMAATGHALPAPAVPDFSGVWAPPAARPGPAGTGGTAALAPSDLTITQTPAELTISRSAFDQTITARYALD